jgi:hypothetical protein
VRRGENASPCGSELTRSGHVWCANTAGCFVRAQADKPAVTARIARYDRRCSLCITWPRHRPPPTNLWRGFLWHIAGGMRTWMRPADRGIDQPTSEAPPKTSNGRGFRNRSR